MDFPEESRRSLAYSQTALFTSCVCKIVIGESATKVVVRFDSLFGGGGGGGGGEQSSAFEDLECSRRVRIARD